MKKSSIEQNLIFLAIVSLGLFLVLGGALFWVQSALINKQNQVNSVVVPAQNAMADLAESLSKGFERQSAMLASQNTKELEPLLNQSEISDKLHKNYTNVFKYLTLGEDVNKSDLQDISAKMKDSLSKYLHADAELSSSIKRRHEVNEKFLSNLTSIDKDLRSLVEAARSISGKVRLDFITTLRTIADKINEPNLDVSIRNKINNIIVGNSRSLQETVTELSAQIYNLGMLNGKLGLAQNEDILNSILANEIAQNKDKITKLIKSITENTTYDRSLNEKAIAIEAKFERLISGISDEKNENSLASLRRQSFNEIKQASRIQTENHESVVVLDKSLQGLADSASALTSAAQKSSNSTKSIAQWLSFLVMLFGLIICAIAGLRIKESLKDLRLTNKELVDLRDSLREANVGLELKVKNRTAAIRAILDNVTFGLFMCDESLNILEGYSQSCLTLFGKKTSSLEGLSLLSLIDLTAREQENYAALYGQIYEDVAPEMSAEQLPSRFVVGNQTISLTTSIVRNEFGKIDKTLFCVADITQLVRAEQEISEARSLLKILRSKERFQLFIDDVASSLKLIKGKLKTNPKDESIHRTLHTIKGNLGVYGLQDLAELVHEIEEYKTIEFRDIDEFEREMKSFVEKHQSLLEVTFSEKREDVFSINASRLTKFVQKTTTQNDAILIKKEISSFVSDVRKKQAVDMLGPMDDLIVQLAQRFGKKIKFEISGGSILLPVDLSNVLQNVTHLVRNSIDHGIESPRERGKKTKEGHLRISFKENEQQWEVKVEDDGRGIDVDRLIEAAINAKKITESQASRLSVEEKMNLIFLPGLSTATQLTDISGRGLGMSAIFDAVKDIHGSITVNSKLGEGSSVTIRIPKTLFSEAA